MKLRHLAITAALASTLGAGTASATTIELKMSNKVDAGLVELGQLKSGARAYGWQFPSSEVQVFEAVVTGDDGQPVVNNCLTGGARIELLDSRLVSHGGASCTASTGTWQFVLKGSARFTKPDEVTAQLLTPTTTVDGRALAPGASSQVFMLIAPRITNTMPDTFTGSVYPVSGYVTMPAKIRAQGHIKLEKQVSGTWKTLSTKRTDSSGKFKFAIPYGKRGAKTRFRFKFDPPKNSGWISNYSTFSIVWN